MKLQARLALLVLIVAGLLAAGVLVLRHMTAENASRLLRDKEREKAQYFDKLVKLRGAPLQTLAFDYTYWDEMVRFAETGDPEWGESQLDESVLENYGVDALWVYTTGYELVYSINTWGDAALQQIPLPIGAKDRLLRDERFAHFFLETPRGPLEIRAASIHPSDDDDRRTPPRGLFFVGRLWDEAYRADLEALTATEIAVRPAAAPAPRSAADAKQGVVRFSRGLAGWEGAPLLRADVRSASPTMREAYVAAEQAVLLLVACAVVLTGVLVFSLVRWVSRPLRLITRSLDRQDPALLVRLREDPAEFGQLATVVERFFEQKRELVREVEERKRAEEQARHDAFHDPLTGLANRALFLDRLGNAMARAQRRPESAFAVLFVDLDRFKVVNDTLGHAIGDQLLDAVGRRLVKCVRTADLVSRLGGDEFAILLEGATDEALALGVAERIQKELTLPFDLVGHEAYTSASVGIALSSAGYTHPGELLRDADTAMYQAKSLGRSRHVLFHDALGSQVMEKLSLETDLRHAVERGELRVHYQPILSLRSGQVFGFEALVRWQHPERGLVPPDQFIGLAEENGLIGEVDRWVLRQACLQMARLDGEGRGGEPLMLSVNVSARQFADPGMVGHVEQILKETGFDPRRLWLEITESAIIESPDAACEALVRLSRLGIRLCLDDFGTGYSSLRYLHTLPVRSLKIDRHFASSMREPHEFEIVRTIVMLARKLDMEVVAEGIETPEQLERLRTLDCELAQGYLFSRPLEPGAAESFLAINEGQAAAS